jgi:hypothetical protein
MFQKNKDNFSNYHYTQTNAQLRVNCVFARRMLATNKVIRFIYYS